MTDDSGLAAAVQGIVSLFSIVGSVVGAYMAYGYTSGMGLTLWERLLAVGVGAAGGGTVAGYLLAIALVLVGLVALILWLIAGFLTRL